MIEDGTPLFYSHAMYCWRQLRRLGHPGDRALLHTLVQLGELPGDGETVPELETETQCQDWLDARLVALKKHWRKLRKKYDANKHGKVKEAT